MVFTPFLAASVVAAASVLSVLYSGRLISINWTAKLVASRSNAEAIFALRSIPDEAALSPSAPTEDTGERDQNDTANDPTEIVSNYTKITTAATSVAPNITQSTKIGALRGSMLEKERALFVILPEVTNADGDELGDHSSVAPLSRVAPRVVSLRVPGQLHNLPSGSQNHTFKPLEDTPSDHPRIVQSWFAPNANDYVDQYDTKVCEPMHEWQLDSRPNCNAFHELDLPTVKLINIGGARAAFEMSDTYEAKFVYKTLKYTRRVSSEHVEEQRKDALILERASGSRFIPDIHGYCSVGVMMDFMPEGNMHDYIKGSRLAGGSKLPPVDKLRIAIHIASAVADMHTMASFFHNDVCCHQFLFQDGIFKLNDFNIAGPFYINKQTGSKDHCTCDEYEEEAYTWKGRSLEEFQRLLKLTNYTAPDPEKVDIWMMGNLIFTILTDEFTFEKPRLDMRETAAKLVAGERTPYPERIRNSTEPSYMAMKTALDMSWTHRWQERPSARSIASYLHEQLKEITGENDPDLRVTLPGRDPKQKGTDSDFVRANCDHTKDGRIKKNCQ